MKKINPGVITLLLLSVFTGGCVSHSAWLYERDRMIGTKFDPSWNVSMANIGNRHRYKASIGKDDTVAYHRMEQEPPNVRYFIKWTEYCQYSLLVSPSDTILSWRFEEATKRPGRACVIH